MGVIRNFYKVLVIFSYLSYPVKERNGGIKTKHFHLRLCLNNSVDYLIIHSNNFLILFASSIAEMFVLMFGNSVFLPATDWSSSAR